MRLQSTLQEINPLQQDHVDPLELVKVPPVCGCSFLRVVNLNAQRTAIAERTDKLGEHVVEAYRVEVEVFSGVGCIKAITGKVQPCIRIDRRHPNPMCSEDLRDPCRDIALAATVDSGDCHQDAPINGRSPPRVEDRSHGAVQVVHELRDSPG